MPNVVLARKSFNDAYNINHNAPVANNNYKFLLAFENRLSSLRVYFGYGLTTTDNYRGFAEAKIGLLKYIKHLRKTPNTSLQNNYVEWQLVLNDLSSAGKYLGKQSEQMFTKIAYILTHDESVDNETKIEVLNDLYDPLKHCAQGAQGEIQSKFLFLQTRSIIDHLRNFVNSIAEEKFLLSASRSIHTRNGILNGFSAKISIMPRIPLEAAAEISDNYIDEKYDLGNFLKYVESHIAGIFSVAGINFLTEQKLNDFVKKLKFLNITNDMLDNLLTIDFGGSYSKWNELLTKIVTDVERYEFINNDQVVTQEASCLYIIKTKKNDFELLLDDQKYFISKKYVKLWDGLQKYSDPNANFYELLDLFNGVENKQSSSYIRLNTHFIHYKLLEELGNIGMLSNALTGQKWSNIKLDWNSNIECISYSMQKSTQFFFINKKTGMHLSCAEMIDGNHYKTSFFYELISLRSRYDIQFGHRMLVRFEQGDSKERFAHNFEVISYWCKNAPISDELVQWLIQNPFFLNILQVEWASLLQDLLKKFSSQQLCELFSACSVKSLMSVNQQGVLMPFLMGRINMLPQLEDLGLLMDDSVKVSCFHYNMTIIKKINKNQNFYNSFIIWLSKNPRFLNESLSYKPATSSISVFNFAGVNYQTDTEYNLIEFLKRVSVENLSNFFAHENIKKQIIKDGANSELHRLFLSFISSQPSSTLQNYFLNSPHDSGKDFAYDYNINILERYSLRQHQFFLLRNNINFLYKMYSIQNSKARTMIRALSLIDQYLLFLERSKNGYYGECMLEVLPDIAQYFRAEDLDTLLVKDANIKNSDNLVRLFNNNCTIIAKLIDLNNYNSAEQHRKNIVALEWLANNPRTFASLTQQRNQNINIDSIRKYLRNIMLRKIAISLAAVTILALSLGVFCAAAYMHVGYLYFVLPIVAFPLVNTTLAMLHVDKILCNPFEELIGVSLKPVGLGFIPLVTTVLLKIAYYNFAEVCENMAVIAFYLAAANVYFASLIVAPIYLCFINPHLQVISLIKDRYRNLAEDNIENKATFKNILSLIYKVNIFANQQPEAKKVSADIENQVAPTPAVRPQLKQQPSKMVTWFYGHKRPAANVTKLASNPVLNNTVRTRLEI